MAANQTVEKILLFKDKWKASLLLLLQINCIFTKSGC